MRDYSFTADCPFITSSLLSSRSFRLSVSVKWKSEVLHFRSFSAFGEKVSLFTVLDKCRDAFNLDARQIKPVMSVINNAKARC